MTQQITTPLSLYKRLESHAQGFDTPAQVIERILDFYEAHVEKTSTIQNIAPSLPPQLPKQNIHLEIQFIPGDEVEFKRLLLAQKQAWIMLYKIDGSREQKMWKALSFKENSSLKGNLLSGYLRGWREKGIYKAEISIKKDDIPAFVSWYNQHSNDYAFSL